MKRTITTMVLAASMMLLAIPAASATHVEGTSQDTAGADTEKCRPGATHQDLVGSWEIKEQGTFTQEVQDRVELRWGTGYYVGTKWEKDLDGLLLAVAASLEATWEFCDKNRDDLLCVMTTDISPYYYTLLDNRPFGH